MKIRLTGLPAEVETAAARIAGVLTVLETSRPYPRRGNSALVSLYLDVTLDALDNDPTALDSTEVE